MHSTHVHALYASQNDNMAEQKVCGGGGGVMPRVVVKQYICQFVIGNGE